MTFGENLKELRTSHALSQKALANKLGFSFQSISKWERNESLPDIETLLAIARFFNTTTDLLLGYANSESLSVLNIDRKDIKLYFDYPEKEEVLTKNLIIAIDAEGKITGTVFIPAMRAYRNGYVRDGYEILDEDSTVIYEYQYNFRREKIIDKKRIRIPRGGFLISVSDTAFASKQIMKFITPEEHWAYLDPDSHTGYYNSSNGHFLFSDILKQNELDHISVEAVDGSVIFKKPGETSTPISLTTDAIIRAVKKELQKEYDKQIQELKFSIDEIYDIISDNESNIDDIDIKIKEMENKITSLEQLPDKSIS